MVDVCVRDGVLQLAAADTTWLSTGWGGGRMAAPVAYNCTVPEGWNRTDLDRYIRERRTGAGFERAGPALLTGVEMRHARCARTEAERGGNGGDETGDGVDVLVVATAGLSNPARLFSAEGSIGDTDSLTDSAAEGRDPGTVNLLAHVDHPLTGGALANLVAVIAEAKAATLLRETGFPGTTTDAVIVGATERTHSDAEPVQFTGSGTPVGAAVRNCVRDALRASLAARYDTTAVPETVADAEHGTVTAAPTTVFRP